MRCAILPVYCRGAERISTYSKAWVERLGAALEAYYGRQSGGRESLRCTVFDWRQIGFTRQEWVDAGMLAGRQVVDALVGDGVLARDDFDHFVILIDHPLSHGGVTPHTAPETSLVAAVGVTPTLVAHELGHRLGAGHTYREGPDGPIAYGGAFCVMGAEGSKHDFFDGALNLPSEGATAANARSGPGMCFINLVRAGWADVGLHAARLQPFANGTLGAAVEIAALNGAPPPNQSAAPVACLIEGEDRYVVEYRSPATRYDQDVPNNAAPHRGDIVVYRSPAEGPLVPLQIAAVEAKAGSIVNIGSPGLAAQLAQQTGGRAGTPLKIVVMNVDPAGGSVNLRVERVPGRPPHYFSTEGLFDFLQWGIAGRSVEVEGNAVLPILQALAEIHDLSRLQRVAGPRDQASLADALQDRIAEIQTLARTLNG